MAEKNLIGDDLPAKADENAFNGRVLTALMSAARKEGRLLAYQLGYDERYPLELGVLETERQVIEPNVGADFCILIYFKKEDGDAIVCAALVQGKIEGEGLTDAYTTNIFRDSSFGVNHQIRSLTSPEKDGYYMVYPRSRATRPIVVAPAQDFLEQVLRSNPRACGDVSRLKKGDCKVRIERASVDLATFLGGVLFDPRHRCSDIGDAIAKFGEPVEGFGARARDTTFLLAERMVLVEIGGRVPETEMTVIEAFGYQRKPAPQHGLTRYD